MDFISGPSTESTPVPSILRKRLNGSTASFTETPFACPSPEAGKTFSLRKSVIVTPVDIKAAALANAIPVALATNGTVRDARGFASNTYNFLGLPLIANWMFIKPLTPTSFAIFSVASLICLSCSLSSEILGITHAESPE